MLFLFQERQKTLSFKMQKQRQTLNHKLNLSPQQIQFLNLLQIPIVDLDKRIEREIEENPERPGIRQYKSSAPLHR